jgi:hypothetical protein
VGVLSELLVAEVLLTRIFKQGNKNTMHASIIAGATNRQVT